MATAKTHDEMLTELLDKATLDDDFRARLIAEPKAAIKEALDFDVPESVTVQVHEDTATTAHLVLPPSPDLTDTELRNLRAGHPEPRRDVYGNPYGLHQHDGGPWHG